MPRFDKVNENKTNKIKINTILNDSIVSVVFQVESQFAGWNKFQGVLIIKWTSTRYK